VQWMGWRILWTDQQWWTWVRVCTDNNNQWTPMATRCCQSGLRI